MVLSPIDLHRIFDGHPVGDVWPYRGGSPREIRDHLQHVATELQKSETLHVEADFNALDDGSMNSAQIYCLKHAEWKERRAREVSGVVVFLNALAPIAFICPTQFRERANGRSSGYRMTEAGMQPDGWNAECDWIGEKLKHLGFIVPARDELIAVIPALPEIPLRAQGMQQAWAFV